MEQFNILEIWDNTQFQFDIGVALAKSGNAACVRARQSYFDIEMKSHRFHLIGKGMFSSVWEKNRKYYKINSNVSGVNDGFYMWVYACMQNSDNPALPKFGDLIQSGQRYCVEIEPLNGQSNIICAYDLYKVARNDKHMFDAISLAIETSKLNMDLFESTYTPDTLNADLIDTYLDIHSSNMMMRGNQLILNDPIACVYNPIPSIQMVKQYA